MIGTALPVQLKLSPSLKYDFGKCLVGEHVDSICTVKNESSELPVLFEFRRVAHFTAKPTKGRINPGESIEMMFSFAPNQVGSFKTIQMMDIIGQVADGVNPLRAYLEVIHTQPLAFLGKSDPVTVKKSPKFNAGITPAITNEVGICVDTNFENAEKRPRAAMLNALETDLHKTQSAKTASRTMKVAFPNDRAQSVRPSNTKEQYKTIFTGMDRHTYIDPDYAYTEEEAAKVKAHRDFYKQFISDMRENRNNSGQKREFALTNNKTDIGIKTAAGIQPKKLLLEEIKPDPRPKTPPNAHYQVLSSKHLQTMDRNATRKPVKEGLNAVPVTAAEKRDCSRILTPQELHHITISPQKVEFGEVCLRSVSMKELNIINNLDQFVHVVVDVDCRELRQTSPLSQVVPPKSKAILPLIFESNTKGHFERSVTYTINKMYKSHVTVTAEVVPVALELNKSVIEVSPSPGQPSDAGFRGVVTLRNKLNFPAEFTWNPILGERGTAFSIRPATGTVEPGCDLDCEIVFHPSYLAPDDGEFSCQVHGGNTIHLSCLAKFGNTSAQFIDRRIMFGQVPLHLSTTKSALLQNTSQNHGFFEVIDPNPFPGLTITPVHGIIPVGGTAELKACLTPDALMKFDTRIQIAIRGWKTVELRMGGTVEPPCVDIDLKNISFGGVYCGSSKTVKFFLSNKTGTKTKAMFDLSRYTDFTLSFPDRQTADIKQSEEDYTFSLMNPGCYTITLGEGEIVACELFFKPTEVASYDFVMPVTINETPAPSPSPTPFPPTPAPSNKNSIQHIINPRPIYFSIPTPRRKIIATALRQPLELSHNKLEFTLPANFLDMNAACESYQNKCTVLVNNSDKRVNWTVDLSKANKALESGIFQFRHGNGVPFETHGMGGVTGYLDPGETFKLFAAFCPREPGTFHCTVPLCINNEYCDPYTMLELYGQLKAPKMWFDPLAIVLTPVPLQTFVSAEFNILTANYRKATEFEIEYPQVECEDGSKISPLEVVFLSRNIIQPCCGDDGQTEPCVIKCKLTFSSPKPVSFSKMLKFIDSDGNSASISVTATSDNCLLTCYPFIAQHRTDHHIICEQGLSLKGRRTMSAESVNAGEAVFVPCVSPPRPGSRPSTSATSTEFQISSSSYESSHSVTESTYPSTPREGALIKLLSNSDRNSNNRQDITSRSLGSALFPEEDSEEGIFHTEVMFAAQRWFSAHGWPTGPNPITIPTSLRKGVSKNGDEGPQKSKSSMTNGSASAAWGSSESGKKDVKTVYDMIGHLLGKPVPGIPINSPLPSNPIERSKQIYWQHATLLTFLKSQGACVASIKPEYLMELNDYKQWLLFQRSLEDERNKDGIVENKVLTVEEEAIEDQLFEAVSKRAWTDILLQLLKTLVFSKVTPRQFKSVQLPERGTGSSMTAINPDPLCSNVYSVSERILLSWLNHVYEQFRERIWDRCEKGGVPPSRWIVNFDYDLLDGLVIGAVLGAHCPFLIRSHLQDMYTHPNTAEQCLHNALKVVNALRHIGIEYDIQGIDITDPNPIALMLLCVHLYQRMPQYLSKNTIEFTGALHTACMRQVRLSNPSNKPLVYHSMIAGRDAEDFRIPKGHEITISPRGNLNLSVEFTSRFLRPAEAVMLLTGRRIGSALGSTLVFNLRSAINSITPKTTVKCESHCYELHNIAVEVMNPFPHGGKFRIVLVEAKDSNFNDPSKPQNLMKPKEKKLKKVASRTDHGQQKKKDGADSPPSNRSADDSLMIKQNPDDDIPLMNAFFCSETSVDLEAKSIKIVDVQFLPFQAGKRQCSIIFINEDIGEFLYSIEAHAILPLPSVIPFKATSHTVRISSAAAAGSGHGKFGGDDSVVYWKCEVNQMLIENLHIPIMNAKREKALLIAAQQRMTEKERERRRIAGTLESCMLTAKTISLLSNNPNKVIELAKTKDPTGTRYKVEVDNDLFVIPAEITLPNLQKHEAGGDKTETVQLPVKFMSKKPGHYKCTLSLQAPDDVRVHRIECTVVPEGSTAELEFTSPVQQSVTQEIPIVNHTNYDWNLEARITGPGFFGPPSILVKACNTVNYRLMFKPIYEKHSKGQLKLVNTVDGTEHVFTLSGKATKPLALDHIQLRCQAKQQIKHRLQLPNVTRKKVHYHVETDLPMVSGNLVASVWPGKTLDYDLILTPLKRGTYNGVVSFVAGKNPVVDKSMPVIDGEVDSDGDEIPTSDDEESQDRYRVWYTVDLTVDPPEPERTIEITCACQKKAILAVGVNNPSDEEINLEAKIDGRDLKGSNSIHLLPKTRGTYELTFSPTIIGKTVGNLTFFHELTGEFWYKLVLTAENPVPTTISHMECELGRWDRQHITLDNPTEETLELLPYVTNLNNFRLERDNEKSLILHPHTKLKIPVVFMPSYVGPNGHETDIIFHSEQLGEWVFHASGSGLMPQPQDPVSVYSAVGSNTTIIIPFRNPMDEAVLVDVILKDKEQQYERIFNGKEREDSAFCLLLKNDTNVRVGPKSTLDIPVSFAPDDMILYEALCVLNVRRYDGSNWKYMPKYDKGAAPGAVNSDLPIIKWLYPIQGIPEAQPVQEKPAVVECQARNRAEERLEVVLSGVAPCAAGAQRGIRARAVTPKDETPHTPDGVVVSESISVTEEFTYEFVYGNDEDDRNLKNAVALSLVRKQRDKISGLVILIFHVVFSPNKTMKHDVQLIVRAATGGVWRFPVRFIATEPTPDDVITIEAVGLYKECGVQFRLTSQEKHPTPFTAFFLAGSDPELSVTPSSGELSPVGTKGTLIQVGFIPAMYGKVYVGRLVVQTSDMQWTYMIRGIPPDYAPPTANSKPPMKGPHPDPRYRGEKINYIRENIKLLTTAVSSPIKGGPQLLRDTIDP
ncbi:cilia and flagella-associated protein 47-like isoform X2 [Tubulanus polymorphus]|uniref:cilia and flagella-associated protein 47-like isoform X2 n=1 Tax=Tubulanus polymorphus TaxID=672921 RepID=UPI003DA412CE